VNAAAVLADVCRCRALRRVEPAFGGFNAAEWGVWIATQAVVREGEEGFGELALLRDVPRTATVTAIGEARLFTLDKTTFLSAVGSHPRAAGEAERLVRERLPSQQATIAP
jgi:hypothetical protein